MSTPTVEQLRRAIKIQEQIEALQTQLAALLRGQAGSGARRGRPPGKSLTAALESAIESEETKPARKGAKRKRVMSAEARERIAAAQRKRWAKAKNNG